MTNNRTFKCLYTRNHNVKKSSIPSLRMENYELYDTLPENRLIANIRNESDYFNFSDSSTYIVILKNKQSKQERWRKYKVLKYSKQELLMVMNSVNCSKQAVNIKTKRSFSTSYFESEEVRNFGYYYKKSRSSGFLVKSKVPPFYTEYFVSNFCYKCNSPECVDPYVNPAVRARLYECHLKAAQERRACSCDSDTLFELMKGFYECYKFKDCDNCSCILCGHLPCEHIGGEYRHSTGEIISKETSNVKRENIKHCLIYIANHGLQLPEGHTKSQRKLVSEVKEIFVKKTKALEKLLATGTGCRSCKTLDCVNPLKNPAIRAKLLECLIRPTGASCCCACNSEVIYKVMKGLYDCYKSRNSETCECILCGHLPCEDLGKLSKSGKDLKTLDIIPLRDKTDDVKDKIFYCLVQIAKGGMHLSSGRSESEEELIVKAREYLKLKPLLRVDTETQSVRAEAYNNLKENKKSHVDFFTESPETMEENKTKLKAAEKGISAELDGKKQSQKASIICLCKGKDIALPEGRTKSEKQLTEKNRKDSFAQIQTTKSKEMTTMKEMSSITEQEQKSEQKLIKGKMKGLIQSFRGPKGKSTEDKENVLKDMQYKQVKLPEPKTASEKELIEKMIKNQIKSKKEKFQEERKGTPQFFSALKGTRLGKKEKKLKDMQNKQLPLPKSRMATEKKFMEKVKKDTFKKKQIQKRVEDLIQSFSDLKDKSPEEKEKILKRMQKQQLPLPESKTASEKKLIKKIKKDMAKSSKTLKRKSPKETETLSEKKMIDKILEEQPLPTFSSIKDKTPSEKEKILKRLAEYNVPLPEPKTKSEIKLIQNIQKEKPATSFQDLKGKTTKDKEKILKAIANQHLALPEPRSPSQKKLIEKVINETIKKNLSDELQKQILPLSSKAINDLAPLRERKLLKKDEKALTEALQNKESRKPREIKRKGEKVHKREKKKILGYSQLKSDKLAMKRTKAQQHIALPVPITSSEQKKIDKQLKVVPILHESRPPTDNRPRSFSALKGITPDEKERILKSIANQHFPLPEPKSQSEKRLVQKILLETPPPALKELKHRLPAERDKILKDYAKYNIPLPPAKTLSEKALVDKILVQMQPPTFRTLKDKTPSEKKRVLKIMANQNLPLPEPKTKSEKELLQKIQLEMPSPTFQDLKGKRPEDKEKILIKIANQNLPLPEPKTPSEKKLIDKILMDIRPRSFSALKGKTPDEKERLLKIIANQHYPLPEPKSQSEKRLVQKILHETPPPTLRELKDRLPAERAKILKDYAKYNIPLQPAKTLSEKALVDKILVQMHPPTFRTLKDKPPSEKERVLKILANQNLQLPEPKTKSEKELLQKIQLEIPSPTFQDLKGKSPEDKEKILIKIANQNLPLPEPKTPSEKKLIDKIIMDIRPRSFSALRGKTPNEKERILKIIANQHLPLPEPKSQLERRLVQKILLETPPPTLKELKHRLPAERDKILKDYAKYNIPLPPAKTLSEKALVDKILIEMPPPTFAALKGIKAPEKERILKIMLNQNVPLPEPKTKSEKELLQKIQLKMPSPTFQDLKGKSPEDKEKILITIANQNLPLPEPKTPSEKKLIDKIFMDIRPRSFSALKGKTPDEKERILKIIANQHLPLPEPKSQSEKRLVQKILLETPPPTLKELKHRLPAERDKILKDYAKYNIPLPPAKTLSEKALVDKILIEMPPPTFAALKGIKAPEKERILKIMLNQNVPLPEPKTKSEKEFLQKIQLEMPSPTFQDLKGKSPEDKEKILITIANQNLPLPEPKTPSEKKLIDKILMDIRPRSFSALKGKTPDVKERILKIMANQYLPLPEPKSQSEKRLVQKILLETPPPALKELKHRLPAERDNILKDYAKYNIPLPPAKTLSEKALVDKILVQIQPPTFRTLKDKTPSEKERVLKILANQNLQLPEPKTKSEKELLKKIQLEMPSPTFQDLKGKSPEDKEKILITIANQNLPLPEPKTPSEKKLIDKIVMDIRPRSFSALKGKTPDETERILQVIANQHLPLPEPKSQSEKRLVQKILLETPPPTLKELNNRLPAERDKILKDYAKYNIPLPPAKTLSEKALVDKILVQMQPPTFRTLKDKILSEKERVLKIMANQNLPLPEPKTKSEKELLKKIQLEMPSPTFQDLKGKSPEDKENILITIANRNLPLPEPKTPSEKKLIDKILMDIPPSSFSALKGKPPDEKERILKIIANQHLPLPEPKSQSEKELMQKILQETPTPTVNQLKRNAPKEREQIIKEYAKHHLQLPKAKTSSEKALIDKILKEIKEPTFEDLKEKTIEDKEKILKAIANQYSPLPTPRTLSERKLYEKVLKETRPDSFSVLKDKTAKEKEKILKYLAHHHLPLPEPKSESEKKIIQKIKAEMPRKEKTTTGKTKLTSGTRSEQDFIDKIKKDIAVPSLAAIKNKTNKENQILEMIQKESPVPRPSFTSLRDKTQSEKELYIKTMARQKLPLPQPKTISEKQLIDKILKTSEESTMKRTLAQQHIPLSEPKTSSEKKMIDKLLKEVGKTTKQGRLDVSKRAVSKVKAALDVDAARKASPKLGTSEIVRKKIAAVGVSKSETAGKTDLAQKYLRKKVRSLKGLAAQEIATKTKCDRACGCDMKKIKFKDSFIKIHVVSPDLSSICPCPGDPPCFSTGLASGVVVNQDVIEVTIGVALGAPSCTYESIGYKSQSLMKTTNTQKASSRYFNEIYQHKHNSIKRTKYIIDGINVVQSREWMSCTGVYCSSQNYLNYCALSPRSSPKSLNIKTSESLYSSSINPFKTGRDTVRVNSSLGTTISNSSKNNQFYDNDFSDVCLENSDYTAYSFLQQSKSKSSLRTIQQKSDDCITVIDNEKITVVRLLNLIEMKKQILKNNKEIQIEISDNSAIKDQGHREMVQKPDKTFISSKKTNERQNSDKRVKKSRSLSETSKKVIEYSDKSLELSDKAYSESVLAIYSFRHYSERPSVSSNNFQIETKENKTTLATEISGNKKEAKGKKELADSKPVLRVDSTEDYTKIVNDFLLNQKISDPSSIYLLIPFDDEDSEESSDTCSSQMPFQLSESFSDLRFLNNNIVDMVNNATKADQARSLRNTYLVQSKHQVLYEGLDATSPDNASVLYSAIRRHGNSRRHLARNPGSFNPDCFYDVESGYTHPLHQDLRQDYDTYETSHTRRRVRPNPPGFTFTRLPKDATARTRLPEKESHQWEKEPWTDQWLRHHGRSEEHFDRHSSGMQQQTLFDKPNPIFDEAGRLACIGCTRGRQSQQSPSITTDNAITEQDFLKVKNQSRQSVLSSIFRGRKAKSVTQLKDSLTSTHSYMVFQRDQETLCCEDKNESELNLFKKSVKSASKLQDSFTSTHSCMVFGLDQATLCQGTEFEDVERGTCKIKEPGLRIALTPRANTSDTERRSKDRRRDIYEDIFNADQNIPNNLQSQKYRNQVDLDYNQTPVRLEDDSSSFYHNFDMGSHELLGYWEISSDSALFPYPQTVIVDCSSSGTGNSSGVSSSNFTGVSCSNQNKQTDTTLDRPCGCVVEKKPCDKVKKDEYGTKVEPGCGSVLLVESGCRKKHNCSTKKYLLSDVDIESPKGTVQQVVKDNAHECAKPPATKKKKEKASPKPKWKPQMAVYGGEQIKLQTQRKMRHPDECCGSHEGIYKKMPTCQSLYHTPSTSKSVTGCRAKEYIKLSNVIPVDSYARTRRRNAPVASPGCWKARSPTGSNRGLRRVGMVRDCEPKGPWSAGGTHKASSSRDEGSIYLPHDEKRVQLGALNPPISKRRSRPRRGNIMKLNSIVSQTISGFELMLGKDVVRYQQQKFIDECISCVCDEKKKFIDMKKIKRSLIPRNTVECECEPSDTKVGGKGIKVKIEAKGTSDLSQSCIKLGSSLQKICSLKCFERSSPKEKPEANEQKQTTTFKEKFTERFRNTDSK